MFEQLKYGTPTKAAETILNAMKRFDIGFLCEITEFDDFKELLDGDEFVNCYTKHMLTKMKYKITTAKSFEDRTDFELLLSIPNGFNLLVSIFSDSTSEEEVVRLNKAFKESNDMCNIVGNLTIYNTDDGFYVKSNEFCDLFLDIVTVGSLTK